MMQQPAKRLPWTVCHGVPLPAKRVNFQVQSCRVGTDGCPASTRSLLALVKDEVSTQRTVVVGRKPRPAIVASIPDTHRYRIYRSDRREGGVVKLPFCFATLPMHYSIVGKIFTRNLEPKAAFLYAFDSQNPAVSPGCVPVKLSK